MTEKRFTYAYGKMGEFRVKDNKTGDYISIINGNPNEDDIVLLDKLNALNDENEQCKMMISTLRNIILKNGMDLE